MGGFVRGSRASRMWLLGLSGTAAAQEPLPPPVPKPDQSSYHLFNPTPRSLRREMSTDRPDTTESPYTVDAGVVQLEMSFFDVSKNGDERTWTIAPFNLKLGLTDDIDLQLVLEPYLRVRDEDGDTIDGVGELEFRVKFNLFGNDSGDSAFALMPFVKIPTASDDLGNGHVEGGVILAYARDLAPGVGLGLMVEPDIVYDEEDDEYDLELLHTAVLGLDVTESVGWFAEYAGTATSDDTDYRAEAVTGFTWSLTADLVLDGGVRVGLTGDADDVGLFMGMSVRF